MISAILEKANTILDIESKNTIFFALLNTSANIYSFQSNLERLHDMEKKLSAQNIENVTVLNYVIGHTSKPVTIAKKTIFDDEIKEDVQMITVDSLGLLNCDFINIESEDENKVVYGAQNTIKAYKPIIKFNSMKTLEYLQTFLPYKLHEEFGHKYAYL